MDPRILQINLTGFLEKNTSLFVKVSSCGLLKGRLLLRKHPYSCQSSQLDLHLAFVILHFLIIDRGGFGSTARECWV